MNNAMKQEFTKRITNANKSELIVILCDMFDIYISDAKQAFEDNDLNSFHANIQNGRAVLSELINSLDRSYEVANNIYSLYRYIERLLIEADIRNEKTPLIPARNILLKLNESYASISLLDPSPAVMQNTETVFAGMTYGKDSINESSYSKANRGYFV